MYSWQDIPITPQARTTILRTILIFFGICGPLMLSPLIFQIVFPFPYPPFALPDMPHRVAQIAFVVFWFLIWLLGLGYLTRLTVRSSRAQASGIPLALPRWITPAPPKLTLLYAIAILVSISIIEMLYQVIFLSKPFALRLFFDGMTVPIMIMVFTMSIQAFRANSGEQQGVQDPYAVLATVGYVFGMISFFFVGMLYLFSPPFALVGLVISIFGRRSSTRRTRANWGLWLSVVGLLAPIIVIMVSMALSHCSGIPGWDCSIPIGIDEFFY
ncbi:hypothetical protein KDW_57910 [Dictyobacter vulcani]|uniref:Uncharacterized protein n=1 Tax=Dictyobacter vulcani TaxID=2607529 RepID=A0A5J4KZY9_9CHLR|nr:hypothetical protein [Dictyobacter vulcani]GER91629.1 hypothetical protein KDW_57910 [Dictyobacter vulcani]